MLIHRHLFPSMLVAEPSRQAHTTGVTSNESTSSVATGAQQRLAVCSRVLVFDSTGNVLYSTFPVSPDLALRVCFETWVSYNRHGASVVLLPPTGQHAMCAQVRRDELPALASCVGDRDSAIRSGLVIEGQRFEVRQCSTALCHTYSYV